MTGKNLGTMTEQELIEQYAANGIAQYDALLRNSVAKFNQIFDDNMKIETELQRRPGDGRSALQSLYNHRSYQVRLNGAKATLAISPDQARNQIEEIVASKHFPQAGNAGMCLWMLDEGMFTPR